MYLIVYNTLYIILITVITHIILKYIDMMYIYIFAQNNQRRLQRYSPTDEKENVIYYAVAKAN